MHETKIDLPNKTRGQVIALLNARLADSIDLTLQAKQAHWNVKGPSVIALHELFDRIAGELEEHADLLAERIAAFGGTAEGTIAVVAKRSAMPAFPLAIADGRRHLDALSKSIAALAKTTRAAIDHCAKLGDAGSADLFTEISRALDKNLWLIEAHLQAER